MVAAWLPCMTEATDSLHVRGRENVYVCVCTYALTDNIWYKLGNKFSNHTELFHQAIKDSVPLKNS